MGTVSSLLPLSTILFESGDSAAFEEIVSSARDASASQNPTGGELVASLPSGSYGATLFAGATGESNVGSGAPPSSGKKGVGEIYDGAMRALMNISDSAERTRALRLYLQAHFDRLSDEELVSGLPELMERALHDAEAVEGFHIAARRGLPQAFEALFELNSRMIDRNAPESWKVPYEEAAMRAHRLLTCEIERDWLKPRALSRDVLALRMFKELILFQDRSHRNQDARFDETEPQLLESGDIWLAVGRLRAEPEAAIALQRLVSEAETGRVRRLGLALLSLRASDGLQRAYAAASVQALKHLVLQRIPDSMEAFLKACDRDVPGEMLETLREILRAGLHAEEIAECLFDKAWTGYQRACDRLKDFSASPFERKISQCGHWLGLLEELAREEPKIRQRLDHLYFMIRASGNSAN